MIIYIIISFIAGGIIGLIAMAILAIGGRADEMQKNMICRELLKQVLKWWNDDPMNMMDSLEDTIVEIQEVLKDKG